MHATYTIRNDGASAVTLWYPAVQMKFVATGADWSFNDWTPTTLAPGATYTFDQNSEVPLDAGQYKAAVSWCDAGDQDCRNGNGWETGPFDTFTAGVCPGGTPVPPTPQPAQLRVSSGIDISPGTIPAEPSDAADRTVTASFTVTNEGSGSYSGRIRASVAGGTAFVEQSVTLAPGQSTTYQETQVISLGVGNHAICAQYESGGWHDIQASAGITCLDLDVVPAADVKLIEGTELLIEPKALPVGGGPVRARFEVRNYGGWATTERFRARVVDSGVAFMETGPISLGAGDSYTGYDDTNIFSVGGVWEVAAEHELQDNGWTSLIGDNKSYIRVMLPEPDIEDRYSGSQPNNGYSGEPVNTLTGNFVHSLTDLRESAPGLPLEVTRWYNALKADETDGPFGYGTSWLYGTQITWRCDKTAVITMADGQVDYYIGEIDPDDPLSMAGSYTGQGETYAALERDADDTATLTFRNQIVYGFDAAGYLASIQRPQSGSISIQRSGSQISRITHSNGLYLDLTYDGPYIASIQASTGRAVTYTYTVSDDLSTVRRPDGSTYGYDFDENHRLIEGRDPNNHAYVHNEYDAQGRVIRQTDLDGQVSTFSYGTVRRYTDALGNTSEHEYDADGRLIRDTDALGHSILMTYDGRGNILTRTSRSGDTWTYTYDAAGHMRSERDPLDAEWHYEYDAQGNRTAQVDPLGNRWSYMYDAAGRLIRVTDPFSNTHDYEYDTSGNLVLERDALGAETHYEYDAAGRQTAIVDALDGRTSKLYDSSGNLVEYTDANQHTAHFMYDALNRLVESRDPCGAVITMTYDLMGNLLSESDGMGRLRHYTYDDRNRMIRATDFRGNATTYGYDLLWRLRVVTDTLRQETRYTYDGVGNRIEVQHPDGTYTTSTYDAEGRLLSETDDLSRTTSYEYDPLGRTLAIHRPCDACAGSVATVTRSYDRRGRLLEEVDPRGAVTQYAYDVLGHNTIITNALGITRTMAYNEVGLVIHERDYGGATKSYQYDELGRRTAVIDPLGSSTTTEYDAVGNVLQTSLACCGYTTTYEYDACDQQILIRDPRGDTTHQSFDLAGNLIAIVDPRTYTTTYRYDGAHNRIAETNPRNATQTREFDPLNREIRKVDALGGISRTTYDAMGRAISETNALSYTTIYTYDVVGRRIAEQTPMGHVTHYDYDSADNLIERREPDGAIWRFEYDENGNQVRQIDPLGNITETTYDLLNRRTREVDAMGGARTFEYDAAGHLVAETDPRGAVRRTVYDAKGQVLREIDPQGGVHTYEYDQRGNRTLERDPLGNETRSEYSAINQLVQMTNAKTDSRRMEYDAAGNLTLETDYRDNETLYGYDEANNRVLMTNPLGHTTWYGYDLLNRIICVTDPALHERRTAYNAMSQVISETNAADYTTHYEYDDDGRLTTRIDALHQQWETEYDAAGRPTRETNPLGATRETEYDLLGRVSVRIDALGNETHYAYDANGHLIELSGPESTVQRYTYDPVGNVLSEQDGNGHVTRYSYDLLDKLVRKIDPLGHIWRYRYDALGNQTSVHQPDGTAILQDYDALGLIIYKGYSARGVVEDQATYEYDADGNRSAMHDRLGDWTYAYDALGRMESSTDYDYCIVRYGYDEAGNREWLEYPEGTRVQYAHNAVGALESLAVPRVEVGSTTYDYDELGRQVRVQQGNGATIEQLYDDAGNLLARIQKDERGGVFASSTFEYDLNGRCILELEILLQGTYSTTYAYDDLGRLELSLCDDGTETHYAYDGAGNRRQMWGVRVREGLSETFRIDYAHNAANQLVLQQDSRLGTTAYRYNPRGERVFWEGPAVRQTYDYDVEGHLVKALVEEKVGTQWLAKDKAFVINEYDGDGRRVLRRNREHPAGTPLVRRAYRYDDQRGWDVLQVEDTSGETVVARFAYDAPLHKLAFFDSSIGFYANGYVQGDHLGSTLGITGEQGRPLAEDGLMRYADYGVERGPWSALQQLPLSDSYTGYESETYTGLQYARNRFYDPATGTFLTPDPFPATRDALLDLHRTLYAHADPVNNTDPLGLFEWSTGQIELGDSLWAITLAAGTTVDAILRVNPQITDPNMIYAGDYLRLPGSQSASQVAQAQVSSHTSAGKSQSNCGEKGPAKPGGGATSGGGGGGGGGSGGGAGTQTITDRTKDDPDAWRIYASYEHDIEWKRRFPPAGVDVKFASWIPLLGKKKSPFYAELQMSYKHTIWDAGIYIGPDWGFDVKMSCVELSVAGGAGVDFPIYGMVKTDVNVRVGGYVKVCPQLIKLSGEQWDLRLKKEGGLRGEGQVKVYIEAKWDYWPGKGGLEGGVEASMQANFSEEPRKGEWDAGPYALVYLESGSWWDSSWRKSKEWKGPHLSGHFEF